MTDPARDVPTHDDGALAEALRREARADAARPVPPLVRRALARLPARGAPAEPTPLTVLPERRPRRGAWRAAAAVLVGLGLLGVLLHETDRPPLAADPGAPALVAGERAPLPKGPDARTRAAVPAAVTADPDLVPEDTWRAAPWLAARAPTPAELARRRGPPAMVRRLLRPRLPAGARVLPDLPEPVADVGRVARGAGVRVQAHVRSLIDRLFWPLRQALTPRDR